MPCCGAGEAKESRVDNAGELQPEAKAREPSLGPSVRTGRGEDAVKFFSELTVIKIVLKMINVLVDCRMSAGTAVFGLNLMRPACFAPA